MQSVVYVSTAYCNIDIECVEEQVYGIDVDPYKVTNIIQWLDDTSVNKLTERYMNVMSLLVLLKKSKVLRRSLWNTCNEGNALHVWFSFLKLNLRETTFILL